MGEGVAVYHGPPGFFVGVGVLVFGFGFEGLSVAVGFDGGGGGVGVGSAANAVEAAIQGRIRAKITNAGKNLGPQLGPILLMLYLPCFDFPAPGLAGAFLWEAVPVPDDAGETLNLWAFAPV